jgi:hypothetical protein
LAASECSAPPVDGTQNDEEHRTPKSVTQPAPRPEPIYAIGSQEYAAQQERLRLQRPEQGEDEDA